MAFIDGVNNTFDVRGDRKAFMMDRR